MLHGLVGMMLIPLLALVLLIISFFAKIPGGVKWAGIVLWPCRAPGRSRHLRPRDPYSGFLHGLNALMLFTAGAAGRTQSLDVAGGPCATATEVAAVR